MDALFLALCAAAFVVICAAGAVGLFVPHSPFRHPYCEITPDISGKRSPDKYDFPDTYLIDNGPKQSPPTSTTPSSERESASRG